MSLFLHGLSHWIVCGSYRTLVRIGTILNVYITDSCAVRHSWNPQVCSNWLNCVISLALRDSGGTIVPMPAVYAMQAQAKLEAYPLSST